MFVTGLNELEDAGASHACMLWQRRVVRGVDKGLSHVGHKSGDGKIVVLGCEFGVKDGVGCGEEVVGPMVFFAIVAGYGCGDLGVSWSLDYVVLLLFICLGSILLDFCFVWDQYCFKCNPCCCHWRLRCYLLIQLISLPCLFIDK